MKLNQSVFALATGFAVTLFGGCVASQGDLRDVYERQARVEAKTERLSRDLEAMEETAQALSNIELDQEQVAQLEERVKELEQVNMDLNQRLAELEGRELSSAFPPTSQPEASAPTELELPGTGLYRDAYTNLSQGNYQEAREQFKSFISENPGSPEATDAQYWIAESYYREGKFEEAILEFQRFIDTYPQDEKVPLAFLKQGLSLVNIERAEEAKLFLQTLIDRFPQSEEASIAREKLKELESKS